MQNSEIAKYLAEIADMMELCGENFFHVRAYRNAARAVLDYPGNFSKLTIKQMEAVPDIGKGISSKLDTLIKTGELAIHQELRKKVPPGLMEVMRLPALGPKRVRQLHEELGIKSLDDMKNALESGALRTIRGFGPKMEEGLKQALERRVASRDQAMALCRRGARGGAASHAYARECRGRARRSRGELPPQTRERRRSRFARDFIGAGAGHAAAGGISAHRAYHRHRRD